MPPQDAPGCELPFRTETFDPMLILDDVGLIRMPDWQLVVVVTACTVVIACVGEGTVVVIGTAVDVVGVAVVAVLAVVDMSAARFADFSAPQATSTSPAPITTAANGLFIAAPL